MRNRQEDLRVLMKKKCLENRLVCVIFLLIDIKKTCLPVTQRVVTGDSTVTQDSHDKTG